MKPEKEAEVQSLEIRLQQPFSPTMQLVSLMECRRWLKMIPLFGGTLSLCRWMKSCWQIQSWKAAWVLKRKRSSVRPRTKLCVFGWTMLLGEPHLWMKHKKVKWFLRDFFWDGKIRRLEKKPMLEWSSKDSDTRTFWLKNWIVKVPHCPELERCCCCSGLFRWGGNYLVQIWSQLLCRPIPSTRPPGSTSSQLRRWGEGWNAWWIWSLMSCWRQQSQLLEMWEHQGNGLRLPMSSWSEICCSWVILWIAAFTWVFERLSRKMKSLGVSGEMGNATL